MRGVRKLDRPIILGNFRYLSHYKSVQEMIDDINLRPEKDHVNVIEGNQLSVYRISSTPDTKAREVLELKNGAFAIKVLSGGVSGDDFYYSNGNPTPIELGGIPYGTTFNQVSNSEMWTMLLYPDQVFDFEFGFEGLSDIIEYGKPVTVDIIKITQRYGSVALKSVKVYCNEELVLDTGIPNDKEIFLSVDIKVSERSMVKVEVTDIKGRTVTKQREILLLSKVYYGAVSEGQDINEVTMKNLESALTTGPVVYEFSSVDQQMCFCIPYHDIKIKAVRDPFNMDVFGDFTVSYISVQTGDFVTDYAVYRGPVCTIQEYDLTFGLEVL